MATLEQTRHIELVSGTSQRFVVTSLMTGAVIPGQLPHLGVFVQRIITRGDPLDDTFQRVARIADLSELPFGRDEGLDSAPGVNIDYLSSTVILSYPTLDEAKAAATAVADRVNALVTSWVDFKTNFEAPIISPIVYTFPSGGDTAVDLLISVYKVAKQDRYQKNLLKLESDAALTRATTDYNYKRAREVELDAMVAKGIIAENDMDGAASFHAALLAAGATFLAAAGAAPALDQATFQTALNVATNETSILASYVVDVSTLTGLINGYDAARVVEVAASSTALAAAQADQITKAQALLTAQASEAAALAEVLAVCPDFEKNSIPMVDDNEP
jgi:hypothetical protein